MKRAAFEEREYETPLYNQLGLGHPNVWAPGQVFEGHIGLDYALFVEDPWIFGLHGYRRHLRGAVLARYRWPRHWFPRGNQRRLPTFRLNLFVQAKRPEWGRRIPRGLRSAGLTAPFWRFQMDGEQQDALETVAATLGRKALVVYAAPAFHEHRDLFLHTRKGTVVPASTFPSASSLSGHTAWYYNGPGASGIANPEPRAIQEPPLEDRIGGLLDFDASPDEDSWRRNLSETAQAIQDALSEDRLAETARRAEFFNLLREVQLSTEDFGERESISAFLAILLFSEVFLVQWYVIGGS